MALGLVFVCLAAVSWGTTGSVMALLARDGDPSPLLVGWARMAGASPCLLLAAALFRPAGRTAWRPRDAALTVAIGIAMAAYQVCYFWAVTRVGVALTALLAICSAPLMIAIGAALVLRERLMERARLALALAVVGTVMLVAGPRGLGRAPDGFALGAAAALGAGLSYAVYAVTAKGLLARVAPLPLAALTFTLAALLLTPVLLVDRDAGAQLAAGWPLLLYLGVVPTALAYALFSAGLRRVPATTAGIATLLEPLTASTLGVLLFGERLGLWGWVGAALLLVALALLSRAETRSSS
jgi:drug/metabolite transporter, DME family